jgi:hypothetical protein
MTIKIGHFFISLILFLTVASNVLGQWVPIKGPFLGAHISCFMGHDSIFFIGLNDQQTGGGVFRSTDSGRTWQSTKLLSAITCLGSSGSNIFAGTVWDNGYQSTDDGLHWTRFDSLPGNFSSFASNSKILFASSTNGLFQSNDHGISWSPAGAEGMQEMVINGNVLFGLSNGLLFRSDDSSVNWVPLNVGSPKDTVNTVAVKDLFLFAGTSSGIFVSTDSGTSWMESGLSGIAVIAFAVVGPNIFAATDSNGAFVSLDNGNTWKAIDAGLQTQSLSIIGAMGTTIFAAPSDFSGIFCSTDNGGHWVSDDSGIYCYDGQEITTVGSNVLALAGGLGVHIYNDGQNWAYDPVLDGAGFTVSDKTVFALNPSGIYTSSDSGNSWKKRSPSSPITSLGFFIFPFVMGGPNMFIGENGTQFSTDSGLTWNPATTFYSMPTATALLSAGPYTFIGSEDGLWRMTNSGSDYTSLTSINYEVYSLAGTDSNLFIGTCDGGVFRSTNEGGSAVQSGLFRRVVFSLTMDGPNLYAGTDSGVFISGNNGAKWLSISTGLNDSNVLSVAVQDPFLYAGTANLSIWQTPLSEIAWPYILNPLKDSLSFGNVFVEDDSTAYVILKNEGKVDLNITSIKLSSQNTTFAFSSIALPATVHPNDSIKLNVTFTPTVAALEKNTLVVSSDAKDIGISLSGNGVNNNEGVKETGTFLSSPQIYPNPFSQSTTITFTSPESGAAEITVVNLLGAEVARIYSGEINAGTHSFTWDAAGQPPGTYWCEIRMNGTASQIPVVLQR